ncbi:MAG TPA: nucleoside-diphosphate sugar epimerase/dehydratase [bacterium]|nr:nucleoside-diphosphate sugar epimerase/dehydratase [bacterium]
MVVSFLMAYLIRFDFLMTEQIYRVFQTQLPWVISIQLIVYFAVGLSQFIWRFIGMREVKYFIVHFVLTVLPMLLFRLFLSNRFQGYRIPISIILMTGVFTFLSLLGIRILRRYIYERGLNYVDSVGGDGLDDPDADGTGSRTKATWPKALLVGAGRAGSKAAEAIQTDAMSRIELVGYVDDDMSKHGLRVRDLKILGTTDDLPRIVRKHHVEQVIIAISNATREQIRRITEKCEAIPVKVRIIPGFADIVSGRRSVKMIRDVQIEDILGRDSVNLDEETIRNFVGGNCVMVTGAGGSIGSELVRQACRFEAQTILLVERSEFALYSIHSELIRERKDCTSQIVPLIADVGDRQRMNEIFGTWKPQVVLHAAAHKHVPMMEFNPGEAVKNNVIGTHEMVRLSLEHSIDAFVLISTDKAVNPTSVMGATKRLAELIVQSCNGSTKTRFLAVRFGNVLGSTGSVIPLFKEQISRGGPVTVTHPRMQRYFMTIPEAVQLVLQASAMGRGGEIFILDMGELVQIADMAERMIRLSGLRPYTDIDIIFTGIRPGEKLFEELNTLEENADKTRHPKIFIGRITALPRDDVERILETLRGIITDGQTSDLRKYLSEAVPESTLTL